MPDPPAVADDSSKDADAGGNSGHVAAPLSRRPATGRSSPPSLASTTSGHASASAECLVVRRNSKDQLDNIKGFGDGAGQRRSSSSSSIRSRRCSGDSVRQIVQLASIKETINSNKSSQQELESLIQAKLVQCRVIFDFCEDPLSDLKYKVSPESASMEGADLMSWLLD